MCDSSLIAAVFAAVKVALSKGVDAIKTVIAAKFLIAGPIVKMVLDALDNVRQKTSLSNDAIALYISVHIEYYKRNGRWGSSSSWFWPLLSNRYVNV